MSDKLQTAVLDGAINLSSIGCLCLACTIYSLGIYTLFRPSLVCMFVPYNTRTPHLYVMYIQPLSMLYI
jgi:hypothetical protein